MALLLLLVAIAAIAWGIGQAKALKTAQSQLQELSRRFKPAMDIDLHVQLGEECVEKLLKQEVQLRAEIESAKRGLTRIHEELALASDAAYLVEVGYYEPRYDFADVPSYEAELSRIREKQKVGLPRFRGQVDRSHAMTLRLSIDDQPNQDKAPVHGAAKAGGRRALPQ